MDALGIDLKLLLAQIVNFTVLFLLLRKFLYQPITKMMFDRTKKIEDGLKNAEIAKKQLAEAEDDAGKIKEKAYVDANDILKGAKSEANEEAADIVKRASEQAKRTLETVNKEKQGFKEKTLAEIKTEIGDVVILALDKITGEKVDKKQKEEIVEKAIREM